MCDLHGGKTPAALAKAERTVAERQAVLAASQLGVLVETSPEQALLDEVHRCAGMVAYYGARAAEVVDGPDASAEAAEARQELVWGRTREKTGGDDAGTTYEAAPNIWLKLWNDERDRLVRVSAACLKAGIEERRVQLAEAQGALVAGAVRRILERLNLTDAQLVLVGEVVPQELRALGSEVTR